MMYTPSGATVVYGGQAGSEGKGAIVGHLALKGDYMASICSFMTNAGHTWMGDNGEKVVVQQVPMAVVNPEIPKLLIGPGSAITLNQLMDELQTLEAGGYDVERRLFIDPRAMIIEDFDAEKERGDAKYLASTMKGCGAALARKTMRQQDVRLARDVAWLAPFLFDTVECVNDLLEQGEAVLVEGSQGFDLDINHGIEYPYCTSRQCTPMQVLADCGIAHTWVARNIAVLRSYPIRVGNVVENGVEVGNSGPFGGSEISFEEIARRAGTTDDLSEYTTVTKRKRRIFELDLQRIARMVQVTRPTDIALTFADYIDASIKDKTSVNDIDIKVYEFLNAIRQATGTVVSMIKTGAKESSIIHLLD